MGDDRKKSAAEKAIDRAEIRAARKVIAAVNAWKPLRLAQAQLAGEADTYVSTADTLISMIDPGDES